MPARSRTIGAGAGFAGDRMEPAVDLATSGVVDDVVLECLAERTIVHGLRRRHAGRPGYDPRTRERFRRLLPAVGRDGCRVVTNLGAADPAGAAEAVVALARDLGVRAPRVAAVAGDDVGDRIGAVAWSRPPQEGEWLGAHAYLGSDAIAAALADGAEVVITGRVADSALFLGPLRDVIDDAPDATAGALVVGHLLECGGQLTGGNHQAPGGDRLGPRELAQLGFPIAVVEPDGSSEIGLLPGATGRVDRFTCALQLLYEVHDPSAYVTPDGVVDMTGVTFEQVAPNRVRVLGARLGDRPDQLKVSGFVALPGVVADMEIGFAGLGALERARDAGEVLDARLKAAGMADPAIDIVGVDSLLGPASLPLVAPPPEVRVHVTVSCESAELAQVVEDELFGLTLSGPPHGGGVRVERRPHIVTVDGRIDREAVREEVVWTA